MWQGRIFGRLMNDPLIICWLNPHALPTELRQVSSTRSLGGGRMKAREVQSDLCLLGRNLQETRVPMWAGEGRGAFIFPRFPPSERASTPGKLPSVKAAPPVHITLMNKMQQARLEQHDQNSALLAHLGGKWTNNLGNRGWGWSTGSPEDFLAKWSFSILLSPKQLYPVMWGGHKSLLPPMTPKSKGAAKRGFR